jgi:hypothetical protein
MGTWAALSRYRSWNYEIYGKTDVAPAWEAHHIFEDRELDYLQVRNLFPHKNQCLCVLIPRDAHVRINSIFIQYTRRFTDVSGIIRGYKYAHSVLGDYSGAMEGAVAEELDKVIRTSFSCAGLLR